MQQIETLQNENRALHAENKRLLADQIYESFSTQHEAQNRIAQAIISKLLEMQKDVTARTDGMTRTLYSCIQSENAATRDGLLMARKQLGGDVAALSSDMQSTAEKIERTVSAAADSIRQKVTAEGNMLATTIADAVLTHDKDIKELLDQYFHQMTDYQEHLATDISSSIHDSNRDFIKKVERYCTDALETIVNTGDTYHQMQADERECLDKIRSLSGEMLELGEHQKRIMEELSQLCRDSDQFLEIQKSINDIWEIMKVVWVDSLLSDYQKVLE